MPITLVSASSTNQCIKLTFTDHMHAYGGPYEESIQEVVSANSPNIPFFSTVTGEIIDKPKTFNAAYWRRHLQNPVLFDTAIKKIIKADFQNPVFLEIGPHSALAGPLRQIFQAENVSLTYFPTLQRGKDDTESMYTAVGSLWRNNVDVDFKVLNPVGSVLTDLPSYSWDHSVKYWEESRLSKEWREREHLPHDILGIRLPGSSQLEPTWRKMLRLDEVGWVRDHQVNTDIVFPGAAYVCMAGEAIRQLTGRSDYSVKGLAIRMAMIVTESKANDVITTFKKAKLTTTTDSEWWEFRISSYNGSTWTEHCSGQAKAGSIHPLNRTIFQPDFLRKVSTPRWYTTMRKIGFSYGPAFQGLKDISADPVGNEAVATVENVFGEDESFYELHPCTVDKLLQLMTVAQHQGNPSTFKQLSVPTYIDEIYISGGMKELRATVSAHKDFMDAFYGDAVATADSKIVFEVKGLRIASLGDSTENEEKPHAAIQLEWRPDINFLDVKQLIRPTQDLRGLLIALEKYFFLCAIATTKIIAPIETQETHLIKFRSWLDGFVDRTSRGENQLVPDAKQLAALSDQKRVSLINAMSKEFETNPARWVALAIRRIYESAKARYEGSVDTLEVLMEGGALTEVSFHDVATAALKANLFLDLCLF